MSLKSAFVRFLSSVVALAYLVFGLTSPAAALTGVCTADSTQICADISALSFSTNGTNSAVSAGKASAKTTATIFSFRFTSNASLARKRLTVGFFDISSGIHLLPGVGDPTTSNGCAAASVIGKSCVIQTDEAGSATFNVKIVNPEVGKGFSYLISGPAGFASSSVRLNYTVTGTNQIAPDICGSDQTRVCGPITRLTMSQNNKPIKIAYSDKGLGGATLTNSPAEVTFHYTSSSEYAYKWMFMKFLNASSGVLTIIDAGDPTSSEACGAADAVGNGCLIQLNNFGSASFIVTFAGGGTNKTVQYEIAGPMFDSKIVTITFGNETIFAPTVLKATKLSVVGAAGMVKLTVSNGRGKTVFVSFAGSPTLRFTPTLAVQTFFFPRAKGQTKVGVTVGKIKKLVTVRVS